MANVEHICAFLDQFAPPRLAEDWDNVGLLVGDRQREVTRVMTCLTVTPASAGEAVEQGVELIVTHHPLPFRALKRLTSDHVPGRLLLQLIEAGVAVCSPHTAFDSAARGINQRLAEGLRLTGIQPLEPIDEDPDQLGRRPLGRTGRAAAAGGAGGRCEVVPQHSGPALRRRTGSAGVASRRGLRQRRTVSRRRPPARL